MNRPTPSSSDCPYRLAALAVAATVCVAVTSLVVAGLAHAAEERSTAAPAPPADTLEPPERGRPIPIPSLSLDTVPLLPIRSPESLPDTIAIEAIRIDPTGVVITDAAGDRYRVVTGAIRRRRPADFGEDDLIRIGDPLIVESDEVIDGSTFALFGEYTRIDGEVTGHVVHLFGNAAIDGTVGGDVIVPFGKVRIRPNGHVFGDVVATDIRREPGGRIDGRREEILIPFPELPDAYTLQTALFTSAIVSGIFLVFLTLIAQAVAGNKVGIASERVRRGFIGAFFIGLVAQITLLPLCVLLLMTIVGIPVVIFLVPLLICAATIVGTAAVGRLIGRIIAENTIWHIRSPMARTLVGVVLMILPTLIARSYAFGLATTSQGDVLRLSWFLTFLAVAVAYVAITVGWGAVIATRFGTRLSATKPQTSSTVTSTDSVTNEPPPDATHSAQGAD